MSEEIEKNKPADGSAQKSGGNHRHRHNRHRSGQHKPNPPKGAQNVEAASSEAKASPSAEAKKPQHNHHSQHRHKPQRKENAPKQPQAEKTASETAASERTAQNENREGGRSRSRSSDRRDNQSRSSFGSSATTLLDTAPEDDFLFGKSASAPKKVKQTTFTAEELAEVREFTDEELFGTEHLYTPRPTSAESTTEVVSIKFRKSGKSYYFSPASHKLTAGTFAIVDTARGPEFGEVAVGNQRVPSQNIIQPLRAVIRPATREDIAKNELNKKREGDAFNICLQKISAHKLDMKLVDVQIAFDNSKILFYFTSAGRVDFRELVRDLASVFKTRIELRQIGIRDEAKMLGGIGICGRPLCCSRFLGNFAQVSIKMAKEQGLSLNSGKISGNCGRLMCCLNFENQTYLDEIKLTPMAGSIVKVDGKTGTVTEATPLIGMLKVHLHDAPAGETITVHRDSVSVIEKKAVENEDNQSSDE